MSIAHELSTEIATAILARKDEPRNLKELKEVVLQVHSALQKLAAQSRAMRSEPAPPLERRASASKSGAEN